MAQTTIDGPDALRAAVGSHLGYSEWITIEQDRIDLFADATGDHEATYLNVSLSNFFLPQIVEVTGFSMGVNYGADSIRVMAPVAVGDRVRGAAELVGASDVSGGLQTTMLITIELDGSARPACVIESISRWLL